MSGRLGFVVIRFGGEEATNVRRKFFKFLGFGMVDSKRNFEF